MNMFERCKESGKRACAAGIKREDCPFHKDSLAARLWREGWDSEYVGNILNVDKPNLKD